jgi:8-amino-7-oxononanoate synthase
LRTGGMSARMVRMGIWDDMQETLAEREAQGLLRRPVVLNSPIGPRVTVDGREVVCLCSNDYLGLAADPAVRQAARDAIDAWGVGSGASRLVCGTMRPHIELERALTAFKHVEDVVVISTGWMANHAAIRTLAGKGDLILCDKLNHASILDAAGLGGRGAAEMRTFPHKDMVRLRALLDKHRAEYRRCLIVTDSLFSMDGDLAPLAELADLKDRYDAQLLIDEAHATGVLGDGGRGAAELIGVEGRVDAVVGTLSKAVGALGGFVAGPKVLADTIRNTSRAYIYTTAPPPAVCAAALAGLKIIQSQPQRRRTLLDLAGRFRAALHAAGLDTGDSVAQIIPVVIGSADRAVEVSRMLLEDGFLIPAIRPPTVPPGSSRLRISLTAGHDWTDLDRLAKRLAEIVCD